jgi:hypothetical protein
LLCKIRNSEAKKERFKNPPAFLPETSLLGGGTEAEAGQFHSPRIIVCPAESKLVFRIFVKKSSNINQKTKQKSFNVKLIFFLCAERGGFEHYMFSAGFLFTHSEAVHKYRIPFSNPPRKHSSVLARLRPKKRLQCKIDLFFVCGEGGIRTPGTVARSQSFQDCLLNHSSTSPCPFTIPEKDKKALFNVRDSVSDIKNMPFSLKK